MANPQIFGTGVVNTDLANVQAAVDKASQGTGTVELRGRFHFGNGTINITNMVTVTGWDEKGGRATIVGGKVPFNINLLAAEVDVRVKIDNVRFAEPQQCAIQVVQVGNLEITNCEIEGVKPVLVSTSSGDFSTAAGIVVAPVTNNQQTQEVSGDLTIANNRIDIGAGSSHRTLGILISQQGSQTGRGVNLKITGNRVSNVTSFGIDCRNVKGTATILDNVIVMAAHGNHQLLDAAIRALNSDPNASDCAYSINNNFINCGFEKSAGIRLHGKSTSKLVTGAIVQNNEITMSKPDVSFAGVLNSGSEINGPDIVNTGIEIRGNCSLNTVSGNKISGSAVAALSVVREATPPLVSDAAFFPKGNTLSKNDSLHFIPVVADIFVDQGVTGTQIDVVRRALIHLTHTSAKQT